ncbi:hypothetical protein CCAE64S_01448 [Castellaniella caeni]
MPRGTPCSSRERRASWDRARASAPPPDAVHHADGWYEYQPHTGPLPELRLTRSPYTADYDWCVQGRCQPLRAVMPTDGDVTLLRPCAAP